MPAGVRVRRAIHPITRLDLGLFTVRRAAGRIAQLSAPPSLPLNNEFRLPIAI
jgi:hypothetical protein